MQKVVKLSLIIINIVSPLIGVLVFGWDITELVFLFGMEAGMMAIFHTYKYGRAYYQLPGGIQKQFHSAMAFGRVAIELVMMTGAFAVFMDSVVGYRSMILEDPSVYLQYLGITWVPLAAITGHYLQAAFNLRKQSPDLNPITPMWIWIFQLPVPALVYSFLLSSNYTDWLIVLLILLALSRGVVEWYHYRPGMTDQSHHTFDPLVLQSSPYSAAGIMSQLFSYSLVMIGFFAINPFTQDPNFSALQNALIYLGCVVVSIPVLYRRPITIQLDAAEQMIRVERGRYWKRHRRIPIQAITRIEVQRNDERIAHKCTFHIKGQKPWVCSNYAFVLSEWRDWFQQLKQVSGLSIPKL